MLGRRIVIKKAGDYSQLYLVNFEVPQLSDNQVLIEVNYAGVNYADCLVRFGVYASAKEYVGWPITPGFEVSGRVLKVGKDITQFKVGDEVIGFTRFNGYSSHLVIDEAQVFHLPRELNMAQGAAFPAVYFTAYYALMQSFRLSLKSKILVHSAAGGVGSALVQIAKAKGFQVAGVVGSSHKMSYLQSLGCDWVYDKSAKNFNWQQIKDEHKDGFHAVFDMCATFLVNYSNKEISELYEILFPDSFQIERRVLPYTKAPVVYLNEQIKVFSDMSFSLVPSWSKESKVKFATHNARIETIAEKPTWKNSLKTKRCLVPLNEFIEPIYIGQYAGNMVRFGLDSNSVLTAAGIYDEWVNRQSGEVLQSFSIVTQEPSDFIAKIGHDRSPIFLNKDAFEYWLNPKNSHSAGLIDFLRSQKQPDEFRVQIDRPLKKGWEKRA